MYDLQKDITKNRDNKMNDSDIRLMNMIYWYIWGGSFCISDRPIKEVYNEEKEN